MKKISTPALLLAFAVTLSFANCSSEEKTETLPPPPASVNQVTGTLKGKELQVAKTGQYGMIKINDQAEIEWIDTTVQKDNLTVRLIREIGNWKLKLVNDTACEITSNDKKYSGTWSVDDKAGEEEEPGIRLRVSYVDPEFSMGFMADSPVTYSYVVKGIDDKKILLQLPRELNRRKLLSLLRIQ